MNPSHLSDSKIVIRNSQLTWVPIKDSTNIRNKNGNGKKLKTFIAETISPANEARKKLKRYDQVLSIYRIQNSSGASAGPTTET